MNKIKLILPLVMVAPTLFGCNKEDVVGNYVVKSENITYEFVVGKEENYNNETEKDFFPLPSSIKETIVNVFTTYSDGTKTEDSTIRLSGGEGVPGVTDSQEEISLYDVNFHKKDEITSEVSFSYGKAKDGYHFYGTSYNSDIGKYNAHNKEFYNHSKSGGSNSYSSVFTDNGFSVKDKILTSNILGKITVNNELKYQINFVVTAKK